MKFIRFKKNNNVSHGYLEGSKIMQLEEDYIQNSNSQKSGKEFDLSEVELLSPVEPGKIIAIGLNYLGHAQERGKEVPDEPMMFMVSPTAVIGDGDTIQLPNQENRIDYEAELAIVIGKEAYKLKKENALDYVFGYTINNDVSDRDLQKKDGQFTRAKSFHTFKPLGPCIATEINPNNVDVKLSVNGEVKQNSNTNDFIHSVEKMLVHVTDSISLKPGDVIITGTPSGVGPLKDGDLVEIEIEGIGKLSNTVKF